MSKLTLHDRCDATACNSAAYVKVTSPIGHELMWCGHHHRVHGPHIPEDWTLYSELRRLEAEHGPNRVRPEAHA